MFYAGLFADYFKNYMKTRLTYRSDFWIEVFSDLLYNAVNLVFILVVFQQTGLLGNWSENQILFIYGYFMIPFAVFSCFFNLWNFTDRYIVKGEMDRVLTRPAYNLLQLFLENMDPASLFGGVVGGIIMVYAWSRLDIGFAWSDPFMLALLVVGSVLIYGGIYVTLTATAFYSDAPTGILPLIYNIQSYGRYPVKIYNRVMQALLTWILPFAFVGFYPSTYFLTREAFPTMALLTVPVGVVFALIGLTVWNIGVRRYRGAGS